MDGNDGLVSVSLGTVKLTDHQRRAIAFKLVAKYVDVKPRMPLPATRRECRAFLQERGWRGLDAAVHDFDYFKDHAWRRGQPDLRGRAC